MDEGALTPASQPNLIGHAAAEAAMLEAMRGRMHHAWLITGVKGIGKATLAYRFARKLLADAHDGPGDGPGLFGGEPAAPTSLYVEPEHPTFQRIAHGGHADLTVVQRTEDPKTGKMRGEIPVDDIRRLIRFFSLTGAETGRRIAIIDAVDDLNRNAANALLKILEEPPKDALLLLVAHRPGRLLPTIISRCRRLALAPLKADEVVTWLRDAHPEVDAADRHAIVAMAEGSIGRASTLCGADGIAVLEAFDRLSGNLARASAADIHGFADKVYDRGNDEKYRIFQGLLRSWITRGTSQAATTGGARQLEQWMELWEKVSHLSERADAVHLDRKQVIISVLLGAQAVVRQG
jgi:DNA polymerase-3 subunit delta'